MPEAAVPKMPAPDGEVIAGRYELTHRLDEGNFGVVYRARQMAYGVPLREVAIKIAKRPMSEVEARRTFGDALLMARLADEAGDPALRQHFVTVYDAGLCPPGEPLAGHPYVVMELVRGGSLQRCLRTGRFPLTRAVACFDQILKAVAFMHQNDIVHRDLKPSNVLVILREDGCDVLKVTDFGLAVEVDRLLGWVASGGDLAHLAPESFSQNICSKKSDVYMLGLLFFELLTGVNPFVEVGVHLRGTDEEKHPELRRLHLAARSQLDLRPLEQHEEIKPRPALGQVICDALRLEMQARIYGDAGQLLAAWEAAKVRLDVPRPTVEQPWAAVRRLIGEAEQRLRDGDLGGYKALLEQAMQLNREKVPNSMVVGRAYVLMVECLIPDGRGTDAGTLAQEGYRRRRCRSTCLAMARYYESVGSPLAASFIQEANHCADME